MTSSRFERSRKDSEHVRIEILGLVDEQIVLRPSAKAASRNSFSRWSIASFRPDGTGMPSSLRVYSRISSKVALGLKRKTDRTSDPRSSRSSGVGSSCPFRLPRSW